jgi:hypothetical protein
LQTQRPDISTLLRGQNKGGAEEALFEVTIVTGGRKVCETAAVVDAGLADGGIVADVDGEVVAADVDGEVVVADKTVDGTVGAGVEEADTLLVTGTDGRGCGAETVIAIVAVFLGLSSWSLSSFIAAAVSFSSVPFE